MVLASSCQLRLHLSDRATEPTGPGLCLTSRSYGASKIKPKLLDLSRSTAYIVGGTHVTDTTGRYQAATAITPGTRRYQGRLGYISWRWRIMWSATRLVVVIMEVS